MLEIFKKLMQYEYKLACEMRSKGKRVVRPSTIYLWALALFYMLSAIDIMPEVLIKPKAFGFIDDLIIIAVVIVLTGSDLGGLINEISGKVPSIRLPEFKGVRGESKVSDNVQGDKDVPSVTSKSNDSNSSNPFDKTSMGSPFIPDNISFDDIHPSPKDDEFNDEILEEINRSLSSFRID